MLSIRSIELMESFGMKEIKPEELMLINGGEEEENCGLWFGCGSRCTCDGSSYSNDCSSKGNGNGKGNNFCIKW